MFELSDITGREEGLVPARLQLNTTCRLDDWVPLSQPLRDSLEHLEFCCQRLEEGTPPLGKMATEGERGPVPLPDL